MFDFGSVQVIATQFDTAINASRAAEHWQVSGRPILPGNVVLPSSWGELRAHYAGPANLELGELGPIVRICKYPWLAFSLDFSYSDADVDTMTADGVPSTASITSLLIQRPGGAGRCQPKAV